MAKFLSVANWDEYQHYKDRNPPWIKLHNHLLDKYEFTCLPDESKAHILAIWMLASRTNNKIPYDARWIANKISATSEVDLKTLIELEFLVEKQDDKPCLQVACKPLHNSQVSDHQEERREEERRDRGEADPDHRQQAVSLGVSEDLWKEYIKTRKRLKASNTPLALTTLINKLKKAFDQGISPQELVEKANESGWKTVYPPEKRDNGPLPRSMRGNK